MIVSIDDLVTFLHEFHAPWGKHLPSPYIPHDLPRALVRIYTEFGNLIDMDTNSNRLPFATQDALVPTNELKYIDGMCEFAWENQGNWSCRFPLGMSDPPVYSNSRDVWEEGPKKGFVQICHSLEHFLITLCLQEAVMSCPKLFASHGHDWKNIFTSECTPLWQNGIYVDGNPSHNFFTITGSQMLVMEHYGTFWMGSHKNDIEPQISGDISVSKISDCS